MAAAPLRCDTMTAEVMRLMSVTVELDPEVEAALRDRAARRGMTLELLIKHLAEMEARSAVIPLTPEERAHLINSLRGRFAHVPYTSEDFIREKREDARREDPDMYTDESGS